MSDDPMKLVKFLCTAPAHGDGRSASALTIHEGEWAFCASGAEARGHEWHPTDGLPLADALRFSPARQAAESTATPPPRPAKSTAPAARGRPRPS